MASVIITFRIMPTGVEVDMKKLENDAVQIVKQMGAMSTKAEIEPIAFGIKAVKLLFVMDEAKGDTEAIETKLKELEDVENVEVTDVRRTLG